MVCTPIEVKQVLVLDIQTSIAIAQIGFKSWRSQKTIVIERRSEKTSAKFDYVQEKKKQFAMKMVEIQKRIRIRRMIMRLPLLQRD